MIPGFVDLQVNGLQGVDFGDAALTPEGVDRVGRTLLTRGVVAYCPTVMTASDEVYGHVLPLLARAVEAAEGARVLGLHVEGPFLNPADGPRGVHPRRHVRPPSIESWERLRGLAADRIALLTLAPELEGALELIEHVTRTSRTVVCLGHHLADAETLARAADLGARACTHVGNGLPEMIHRHRNPLWPMLANDRLHGTFIADGRHLTREQLIVGLRAKGVSRFIVTSDVTQLAGRPPGEYVCNGVPVVLEEDGLAHRKGAEQLAGSTSDMLDCMNVMAALGELDEEGLRHVGYDNPLALLGLESTLAIPVGAPTIQFDGQRLTLGE